jgi:hypothetical protein
MAAAAKTICVAPVVTGCSIVLPRNKPGAISRLSKRVPAIFSSMLARTWSRLLTIAFPTPVARVPLLSAFYSRR